MTWLARTLRDELRYDGEGALPGRDFNYSLVMIANKNISVLDAERGCLAICFRVIVITTRLLTRESF